jgi:outer membrane protein assembly factor BamB
MRRRGVSLARTVSLGWCTPATALAALVSILIGCGTATGVQATSGPLRSLVVVSLPGEAATPALDRQSLWVSIPSEAILLRLDARSGRKLARIDLHQADRRAFGGGPVVARRGIVWIGAPVHVDDDPSLPRSNSGWIARFDSHTGKFHFEFVTGDPPAAIAVGPAGVWISGGHTIRQVDPNTGRIVASVSLGRFLGDLVVGTNALWVSAPHAGALLRIDPRTHKIVREIRIGPTSGSGPLALGPLLWAASDRVVVGIDRRTSRIVRRAEVTRPNSIAADGREVWVYTPRGLFSIVRGAATRRLVTREPSFGAVVARGRTIWLSDLVTQTLRRIGP